MGARVTTARIAVFGRGRRLALPRPRVRTIVAAVLALVLLVAGGLWLRDSPLVAVEHVKVTGASGPDGRAIRSALTAAARDMTTLHVRRGALHDAVARFPAVKELRVSAHPLHGLGIEVIEYVPVAVLVAGDRRLAVAADGTVLRHARLDGLPLVPAHSLPSGDRVRDRQALGATSLAGAAPAKLRALVTRVRSGGHEGLRVDLRGGVRVVFGSRDRLAAKWTAVARVLADPKASGASYLDVRVPERPVAGGFADPSVASSASSPPPAGAPGADQPAAAPADPSAAAADAATTAGAPQAQSNP
jgi:cell division protein FtsQ